MPIQMNKWYLHELTNELMLGVSTVNQLNLKI